MGWASIIVPLTVLGVYSYVKDRALSLIISIMIVLAAFTIGYIYASQEEVIAATSWYLGSLLGLITVVLLLVKEVWKGVTRW